MEDEWRLTVHDAKSGNFVQAFQPTDSGSSWATSIAGDGTSTETIVVNDADEPWTPAAVASVFEPNDRLIARWWGDFCMYTQKIEKHSYDRDAGTLVVSTVDLIGETDWRLIDGVANPNTPTLDVVGRSGSGAIRAVLARMMQWEPNWVYPIDLPPDGAGPVTASWPFWKKLRLSDIIKEIEDQTGVETFLRAYGAGSGVRFQTLVAPKVTVGTSKFNLDAAESPLGSVKYTVDGARQVTGILGLGNGSGQDQETAWAGGIINVPIRDTKQSFPDLTGSALQAAVNAYYAENVLPVKQWSIGSFTIGDGWTPEHAAPGRVWSIESHGDPVIPDGTVDLRVIKVSGGNGRELSVEVQSAAA